jgi:Chaperone of endosialidase
MRKKDSLWLALFTALALAGLQSTAVGQDQLGESKAANLRAEGTALRFDPAISFSSATLTVAGPDGIVYRKEFTAGAPLLFALLDKAGATLGEGQYTYELRFTTAQLRDIKERAIASVDDGTEDEQGRVSRRRLPVRGVVQSGAFMIQNGAVIAGGETEPVTNRQAGTVDKETLRRTPAVPSGNTMNRLRNHRLSLAAMPDVVTADDAIIQGSLCVGLDCVNNESFGFDTIRLKENNTRIKFEDTSVGTFPSTDWQLTANDSASGGANKFSIEDITGSKVPFTITAGAATNSIFVSSNSKVGFRTSTPVLDLHVNTTDTPAARFEQNNSGGFTAQTWDVAGNEANFFVRDVTGGSRLPFRIRPGAPTSSIDINSSGQVGIGTASPSTKLEVVASSIADGVRITGNTTGTLSPAFKLYDSTTQRGALGLAEAAGHFSSDAAVGDIIFQASTGKLLLQSSSGASALAITTSNSVGIGTTAPDQKLSVNGDASKTGGNTWLSFSDERLKNIKGRFNPGLKAVMQLQPIRYEYKRDNPLGLVSEGDHIGFGASAVQKVIPEAVTRSQSGYLMLNSDPILWTMLNAIKEQQKEIAELKGQIKKLQTSHRRRR